MDPTAPPEYDSVTGLNPGDITYKIGTPQAGVPIDPPPAYDSLQVSQPVETRQYDQRHVHFSTAPVQTHTTAAPGGRYGRRKIMVILPVCVVLAACLAGTLAWYFVGRDNEDGAAMSTTAIPNIPGTYEISLFIIYQVHVHVL